MCSCHIATHLTTPHHSSSGAQSTPAGHTPILTSSSSSNPPSTLPYLALLSRPSLLKLLIRNPPSHLCAGGCTLQKSRTPCHLANRLHRLCAFVQRMLRKSLTTSWLSSETVEQLKRSSPSTRQ